MNLISKLTLLLALSFLISACGGKKKAVSGDANVADITRPPTVEKDTTPVEEAFVEGETVSFDEWRKRREAQRRKLEQDQ